MTAKELEEICLNVENGQIIRLNGERIDVYSDSCQKVYGYPFSNTATKRENPDGERPVLIYMKNKKNVRIDGGGAELVLHGIMTPFLFDSCENIVFENFTIDYEHPTMSEFTILSQNTEKEYEILVAKDTLFDIVEGEILWHGERGQNGEYLWQYGYRDERCISMFRDPKKEWTQMLDREEELPFPCVPAFRVVKIDGKRLTVELNDEDAFFPVGCVVQTRSTDRIQIGGCFQYCKNVLMQNITVRAMNGFGILSQYCEDTRFSHLNITPKEGRTIASNADFIHASGCKGYFIVEDSEMAEGHDDFVNVHGTHLKIVRRDENKLLVRFVNPNSWGFRAFEKGDRVAFIDKNTLLPYGEDVVVEWEKLSDTDILLTLEKGEGGRIDDCIENVTATPEIVIRNNKFGPSMGRGVLCTSRKKTVIENNRFYKLAGAVLCVCDDCNFWYESGPTTDVLFQNNEVIGCGYGYERGHTSPIISVEPQVIDGTSTGFVHGKITVINNDFSLLPEDGALADVKWTKRFVFENNRCDKQPIIYTHCVGEIVEKI